MLRDLIRRPEKSSETKRAHFANVDTSEIFIEATPTVFIQLATIYNIFSKKSVEEEWNCMGFSTA